MKIVNFKEFVRMPAGTVFAPYTPCITKERPKIKTDTGEPISENTWSFIGAVPIEPEPKEGEGYDYGKVESEFFFTDDASVDYYDEKMFLIFEKEDIEDMIKLLFWAKEGCPGDFDEWKNWHSVSSAPKALVHTPTFAEALKREEFIEKLKNFKTPHFDILEDQK